MVRFVSSCWILIFSAAGCLASTSFITDFSATNPLTFAYPTSTWSSPVNQFEFFTDGSVLGQEIVPIGGGNPTVSGGAGHLGLNLDLSGATALQLTALLLPLNQATAIQALLFDADGTILRFNFAASNYNKITYASAVVNFASATTVVAGTTVGFDLSHVTAYEIQGNFFDGSGNAAFDVRLDDLRTVGTPEPSTIWLFGTGLLMMILGVLSKIRPMKSRTASVPNFCV
jgi:hypothetical protein